MTKIFLLWIPASARMSARVSRFERSAADQILIAVEQHHFNGNLGSGDDLRSGHRGHDLAQGRIPTKRLVDVELVKVGCGKPLGENRPANSPALLSHSS